MKEKSKSLLGFAGAVILLLCAGLFAGACFRYIAGQRDYRKLIQGAGAVFGAPVSEETASVDYLESENLLKSENRDYLAWIQIDGTGINYPVAQGREDGYYLDHTFSGLENPCGSIFMDVNCSFLGNGNTILYGHNMKDGSMFADIKKYRKQDYWKEHEWIQIYVDGRKETLRVFACILAEDGESAAYTCTFGSMEEKLAFIDQMKASSVIQTDYTPQPEDVFLTLSTCTGPNGKDRLLLLAGMPVERSRERRTP